MAIELRRILRVVSGALLLLALPASAKRTAPAEVEPVVIAGVRYEVPHFDNPCGQSGGCVVARDEATGSQLWWVKVYATSYDPFLEKDVQDVFITAVSDRTETLQVTDEKGRSFTIDLRTHAVAGGSGCSAVATSPSALGWWGLLVLGLARRRSVKLSRQRGDFAR